MYVGDPIIIHPLPHVVISIGWAMEVLGVLLKKETDSKTNKGEFYYERVRSSTKKQDAV